MTIGTENIVSYLGTGAVTNQAPNNIYNQLDEKAAKKVSKDFEAFFLSQVMESMSEGIEPNSMFGGGQGEKMFRSLLYSEYAKQSVNSGGIGIADKVYQTILQAQEAASTN